MKNHTISKAIVFLFFCVFSPIEGIAQTTFSQEKVITTTQADGVGDLLIFNADGQGQAEIVTLNTGDEGIYYFQNLGDMNFNTALSIVERIRGISSMTAGIVDDSGVDLYSGSSQNGILVHDNNGSGGFGLFVIQESLNDNYNNPRSLSISDIDNDGNMDLLFVEPINNISSNIHIIFSVGDSRADSYEKFIVGGVNSLAATDVISGDVDGDGLLDIIIGSFGTGDVDWVKNNGNRNFGSPVEINPFLSGFRKVLGADYDGDNDLDLFVLRNDRVMYLQNNGSGNFSDPITISFLSSASDLALGDMDNDGNLDVIVSDASSVSWARNAGNGGFDTAAEIYSSGASAVAVGDLRGDGDLDVVVGVGSENKILLFENFKLGPSNQPPIAEDDSYSTDQGVELTVSAEDGVLSNDSDPEGSSLSFSLLSLTSNGDLDVTQQGGFTYTPDPDFFGEDEFTYSITDDGGATAEATVTITVNEGEPVTQVTFEVYMDLANDFDPTTESVFVSGSFSGWNTPGSNADYRLSQSSEEETIYTLTLGVEEGVMAYKFFVVENGTENWDNGEWPGEINREDPIASDTTIKALYGIQQEESVEIGTARNLTAGAPVMIQGRIASPDFGFNSAEFFLQDESGGVLIFWNGFGGGNTTTPFTAGNEVSVSGSMGSFNDQIQVSAQNYQLISTDNSLPEPVIINREEWVLSSPLMGTRVTLQNVTLENIENWPTDGINSGSGLSLNVEDEEGNIYVLRIDRDESYFDGSPAPADTFSITGSMGRFRDEVQLYPFFESDLVVGTTTVSNEMDEKVTEFSLHQNYPNPFNPSTIISYQLPVSSTVSLKVFDMLGREVASLINNERISAGTHSVTFGAENLSSGMYIYRLETAEYTETRIMTLIK